MKSIVSFGLVAVIIAFSCNNETIAPVNEIFKISVRDGGCDDTPTALQYDLLAPGFYYAEWETVLESIKPLLGDINPDSLLDYINTLVNSSYSLSDFLDSSVADSLSAKFKKEVLDFQEYASTNIENSTYPEETNSLISEFISNDTLSLFEKDLLVTLAEGTIMIWEFGACEKSAIAYRSSPHNDGQLCNINYHLFSGIGCEIENHFLLFLASYIGYDALELPNYQWEPGGAATVLYLFLLVADLYYNITPCISSCDDCHHPSDISLISDFENCKLIGANADGAFQFAEQWDWEIIQGSTTHAESTTLPRVVFPSNFPQPNESFVLRVKTLCDGMNPPLDNYPPYYQETIITGFDPIAWMIIGSSIVDDLRDFQFESSETFGNLINPSWNVSSGVQIVETGTLSDGRYYAIFNFSNVTSSTAVLTLTLYDECDQTWQTRYKEVRLVQA